MWSACRRTIRENWGETIAVAADGTLRTVREVIMGWRDDAAFRDFFIQELARTAYPAFFWEMPSVTRGSLSDGFECALICSNALAQMQSDGSDFAEHLNSSAASVVSFRNLGGDAVLIAPRRITDADCYAHIGVLVRAAPHDQRHALFQLLAEEMEKLLQAGQRFWVSTSGLGVPWVHVRLDSYPKYYQHRPYAER
jgi:Family of unknown function (DUF6940)